LALVLPGLLFLEFGAMTILTAQNLIEAGKIAGNTMVERPAN
jgi:hypothetical protein